MSSNWRKLDIDDIPKNVFTGKYLFLIQESGKSDEIIIDPMRAVKLLQSGSNIRFKNGGGNNRPTHNQIMSMWWKTGRTSWTRVQKYDPAPENRAEYQLTNGRYFSRHQFTGLLSSEIPPEV